VHDKHAANTDENEFGLPAHMACGMTKRPFQIHEDKYGRDDPEEVPYIT
jgi:hypothetical protein